MTTSASTPALISSMPDLEAFLLSIPLSRTHYLDFEGNSLRRHSTISSWTPPWNLRLSHPRVLCLSRPNLHNVFTLSLYTLQKHHFVAYTKVVVRKYHSRALLVQLDLVIFLRVRSRRGWRWYCVRCWKIILSINTFSLLWEGGIKFVTRKQSIKKRDWKWKYWRIIRGGVYNCWGEGWWYFQAIIVWMVVGCKSPATLLNKHTSRECIQVPSNVSVCKLLLWFTAYFLDLMYILKFQIILQNPFNPKPPPKV